MVRRGERIFIALCLVFCLFIGGCHKEESKREVIEKGGGGHFSKTGIDKVNDIEELEFSTEDITQRALSIADSILSGLTLEERIGQCLMPSLPSSDNPLIERQLKVWMKDYHIGGVVLLKGNLKSVKNLSEIGCKGKVPLFIAIDAEWGLGMRLEDAPKYPKNGLITKETDEVALFDYGQQIAYESKETGINMILGPVIDVSSIRGGIIGKRSFGDNPKLVSSFGIAYAKGLESGGVISVAKHFPGHGGTWQDSHYQPAYINRTITALDTMDLSPFKNYVKSGLSGIMAGHIQSTSLDPEGKPASVSTTILTDLLRGEMGFQGLILTDAFDMGGIKGFSPKDALRAGADIILCPGDLKREYESLVKSVTDGTLDISIINERCLRILFYKTLFLMNRFKPKAS